MARAKVDIAIACAANQTSSWWSPLIGMLLGEQQLGIKFGDISVVSSAMPDYNKNATVNIPANFPVGNPNEKKRNELTDANRNMAVSKFMEDDNRSDWIFWIDDDTVPPKGVISHLLEAQRDFIAGVYFHTNPPHLPIAYHRREDGLYQQVTHVQGALQPVDSVGMGCTLIHKSVYEKIFAEHRCYVRPNGSLVVVHSSQVKDQKDAKPGKDTYVRGGYLHVPVRKLEEDTTRVFPFYAMEYARTEDHHFCELADNVGITPWLDGSVTCEHFKIKGTTKRSHDDWQVLVKEQVYDRSD